MTRLFRAKAMQTMAAPEQLNEAIRLVDGKSRWATRLVAVMTLLLLAWLFLGSIPKKTTGLGLSAFEDSGVNRLRARAEGVVERIHVDLGAQVSAGDILIELEAPELAAKVREKEAEVAQARAALTKLKKESARAISERAQLLKSRQKDTASRIDDIEQELALARKSAKLARDEFQKQLVSRSVLEQATAQVDGLTEKLNMTQEDLAQARQDMAAFRRREAQTVRQAEDRFNTENGAFQVMRQNYKAATRITTPSGGTVAVLPAAEGVSVTPGTELARIITGADSDSKVYIKAFLKLSDAKKVREGMEALVAFTAIEPEVFGSAVGVVERVGLVSISTQELAEVFGDTTLSGFLSAAGPVVPVVVRLQEDPATASGYRWTSRGGYPGKIGANYQAAVSIKLESEPPVNYIAPVMPVRAADAK